ncbi:MAG: glycosyltransferase [Candidatus Dadabacteria bacterium]|nr:MAG: glycosyltransferase [Candidatus Dadabacteria bacterium]
MSFGSSNGPGVPELSIVIPVYNEEANLEELTGRLLKVCRNTGKTFEIIFVDDGSRDRSAEMLREYAHRYPGEIVAVILNRNFGQHAAVMAGFQESRGRMVVTLDADLQNPPEAIPDIVAKLEEGFDVVGSYRKNRQDPFFRRFCSSLVNKMVRACTGVMMTDYGCMLRGYSRTVVDAMLSCHERSTFIPVLANSLASKTTEIGVPHSERQAGESKYNIWKLISLQFDLLTSMTTAPLRMLSVLGGIISLGGVLFGLLLLVLRLAFGAEWAAEGVFTLFSLLFIFIGAQFFGLGLLGEYIGRISLDVRGRPRFIIKEVIGGRAETTSANQAVHG